MPKERKKRVGEKKKGKKERAGIWSLELFSTRKKRGRIQRKKRIAVPRCFLFLQWGGKEGDWGRGKKRELSLKADSYYHPARLEKKKRKEKRMEAAPHFLDARLEEEQKEGKKKGKGRSV